jgi:hypothetical protein
VPEEEEDTDDLNIHHLRYLVDCLQPFHFHCPFLYNNSNIINIMLKKKHYSPISLSLSQTEEEDENCDGDSSDSSSSSNSSSAGKDGIKKKLKKSSRKAQQQ